MKTTLSFTYRGAETFPALKKGAPCTMAWCEKQYAGMIIKSVYRRKGVIYVKATGEA
jgi:hypothetical protein